jgi:hypothetical protein
MKIRYKLTGFVVTKIRETMVTHAFIWLISTSVYLAVLSLTIYAVNLRPQIHGVKWADTPVLLFIRCRMFPKHRITCLQSLAGDKQWESSMWRKQTHCWFGRVCALFYNGYLNVANHFVRSMNTIYERAHECCSGFMRYNEFAANVYSIPQDTISNLDPENGCPGLYFSWPLQSGKFERKII